MHVIDLSSNVVLYLAEFDYFILRNSYIDVVLYILQEVFDMIKQGRSLVAAG